MKYYWLILITLFGLLVGCAQDSPDQGDVLTVTDGTSEQSYSVDDLESLGAEEAVFQEVTYVGVPLPTLLSDAGFDPASASAVKATAADGFTANYEPELANRPDTLVAYARADGPLTDEDGTFRMVLPGQEGRLNPRDLVELQVYP
jgi:DMSO/TMAO reductase YedYZ molybdopterin-dependent catalytic subunit